MNQTVIRTSDLEALDKGAFRDAIARWESVERTNDVVATLWRAEVALYLERVEEALAEIDSLKGRLDGELALRAETIRAEAAFLDDNLDEAERLALPVIDTSSEINDTQGHLRATLLYGRTALRRGDCKEALSRLTAPRVLATVLGNTFYTGIIGHCRAYCYMELSQFETALSAFSDAIRLLKESEGLKWEANCRILRAGLLSELDRSDEALVDCEVGERIGAELGVTSVMLWARNNAAHVRLALGQFQEVIRCLKDSVAWQKETRLVSGELVALQMLSTAQCELGLFDEAIATAQEAVRLASVANRPNSELDGQLLAAWASLKQGDFKAATELQNLLVVCDSIGSEHQRAEARLYLADGLWKKQPAQAQMYADQAAQFAASGNSKRLRKLSERVMHSLNGGPVRLGPNGELIIDCRHQWPDYDETIEVVRRHLIFGAVEASDGNRSEAGRKLGLTRSRLHDLWHQLNGNPIRPTHQID